MPQEGVVVAVGPGKSGHPLDVKVGDHVLYGKYSGQPAKVDGMEYLVMREEDVCAIVSG